MQEAFHAARQPIPYRQAQELQRRLSAARLAEETPDLLWLLEHPPTVTCGSAGGEGNLRCPSGEFRRRGVEFVRSERGGNVTYHAPGQLIGYPIVDLRAEVDRDLPGYLRALEGGLIEYLATLGLAGRTVPGRTGVWLDEPLRKIAAMGIRAKRWIVSHGFALNVENSLEGFDWIVPCGIPDAGVTSLLQELGPDGMPPWETISGDIHRAVEKSLERPLELVRGAEVLARLGSSP
jgi:lipoyl(octanoyl) transferase